MAAVVVVVSSLHFSLSPPLPLSPPLLPLYPPPLLLVQIWKFSRTRRQHSLPEIFHVSSDDGIHETPPETRLRSRFSVGHVNARGREEEISPEHHLKVSYWVDGSEVWGYTHLGLGAFDFQPDFLSLTTTLITLHYITLFLAQVVPHHYRVPSHYCCYCEGHH